MAMYPAHIMAERSDIRSIQNSVAEDGVPSHRPAMMHPSYVHRPGLSNAPYSREVSVGGGNRPSYMPVRTMPSYQGNQATSIGRLPSKAFYPNYDGRS
jgi:hypothetical protein